MAPGLDDVKRFFTSGNDNGSSETGTNQAMPNPGMKHPERKEEGPNVNGSATKPLLGSHGKPLMTTAAGHPISDDNNRYMHEDSRCMVSTIS